MKGSLLLTVVVLTVGQTSPQPHRNADDMQVKMTSNEKVSNELERNLPEGEGDRNETISHYGNQSKTRETFPPEETHGTIIKLKMRSEKESDNHTDGTSAGDDDDDDSDSQQWRVTTEFVVSVVIIGMVILGIIFVSTFSSWTQSRSKKKPKKKVTILGELSPSEDDYVPLVPQPPRYESPNTVIQEEGETLWEAVEEGDTETVERLLEEGLHPDDLEGERWTTPHMDAHILGTWEILQLFTKHKGEKPIIPADDLIKSVLYELEKKLKRIFVAAECGMYDHEHGVDALLKEHHLPGTVTDHHRRSLLHYMACVTIMDGRPSWEPHDIRKFLDRHDHYVNAVDYKGRTALHELSQHPQEAEVDVIWDGKDWEDLSDAWLTLARLLTSRGCDPRIPDHLGRLPHHLAREANNHHLADFLQQKCAELGDVDLEKATSQHDRLVSAARQGDTAHMRELLKQGVPLLPVGAQGDPLVEAIRHSQKETVLLLLCAGAPLSSRLAEQVTPLEVAHTTLGLPAVFPALIRKAVSDRLEDEKLEVDREGEWCQRLKKSVGDYCLQVVDVGSKAKWVYSSRHTSEREVEARTLLSQASELGLSLTCQILGLESVYFNSLPGEKEKKAFERAISSSRTDTLCVLYRDLKLVPYVCGYLYLKALPLQQVQKQWISEYCFLDDVCSRDGDGKIGVQQTLKELKRFMDRSAEEKRPTEALNPSDDFLYLVAKHGTPTVYHALSNILPSVDVNRVIQEHSGSTMLHISAMFGQINMIEYLIHSEADVERKTTGGYTAAHVAALSGYKKCCNYILAFMAHKGVEDKKCFIGLTPTEMMEKYEDVCRHSRLPLLPHEDALCALNERSEENKATQMLQKKGQLQNIRLPDDLVQYATDAVCDKSYMQKCLNKARKEVENICSQISDERLQGKLIPDGPLTEGNGSFDISQVSFIYEVSVLCESPGRSSASYKEVVKDGRTTVVVETESDNEFFTADTFRKAFVNSVTSLVRNYEAVSSNVSLAPPFTTKTRNGLCLFWIVNTTSSHIKVLKTSVVPVLPAVYNCSGTVYKLPSGLNQPVDQDGNAPLHVTNVDKDWVYRSYSYENHVFSNLETNYRKVWLTCRLLNKLLEPCWWSPRLHTRWGAQHWHTRSVGVGVLPDHALKALFLRELAASKEWEDPRQRFERVYSIFRRATHTDMRGKLVPRENVNLFLPSHHYCSQVPASVCGILRYLDQLREAQVKQDKIPKVKFV